MHSKIILNTAADGVTTGLGRGVESVDCGDTAVSA
jgi:hypothetical protein